LNRRKSTLKNIVIHSEKELDYTILRLWELGLDYVVDENTLINFSDQKLVRKVAELPSIKQRLRKKYWCLVLGITILELEEILVKYNFKGSLKTKKIPKYSLGRLRKIAIEGAKIVFLKPEENIIKWEALEYDEIDWNKVGHVNKAITHISVDDVKKIHETLTKEFINLEDPIIPSGIRDQNLLESAITRPHSSIGDASKYSSIECSAAALLHSLVHNHAFYNGNKRTALVSMLVFLDENGYTFTCKELELFKFVLHVAQHEITKKRTLNYGDSEVYSISIWIQRNIRPIVNVERPLPLLKLKQILQSYNCRIEQSPRASKIKIFRTLPKRKYAILESRKDVQTTCPAKGEGREISKLQIRKIRQDLYLTDEHGVDSSLFYDNSPMTVDDFIIKYRKILKKLARF